MDRTIEIKSTLDLIEKIWRKNPDLRLCQLLGNLVEFDHDLYYMDDNKLYQRLCEVYGI